MSATILFPDGKTKHVKNLGWLIRNAADVAHFSVKTLEGGHGALLTAYLGDGRRFVITFADASVLREWLHRRSFRGMPVDWDGEAKTA